MKAIAAGLLVSVVCTAPLLGQERDRALERISLALQQPLPLVTSVNPAERARPKRFGILTFVPPAGRGELVRVSIPIGELISRAFKQAAAAGRRREEAAARRKVAAALERFKARQQSIRE